MVHSFSRIGKYSKKMLMICWGRAGIEPPLVLLLFHTFLVEELLNLHLEDVRQLHERADPDVFGSSFDRTREGAPEPGLVGEFFLAPASSLTKCSNPFSKFLSYCNWVLHFFPLPSVQTIHLSTPDRVTLDRQRVISAPDTRRPTRVSAMKKNRRVAGTASTRDRSDGVMRTIHRRGASCARRTSTGTSPRLRSIGCLPGDLIPTECRGKA
jgi:hypothetical protein